ncbi:TrmH family RNA methyltransferase [Desulfovermiculus halophilus]|jgi:tRNA (guanosine-2'-O-)-methyltransferase|uniref:TrmH family RNA methyltransferase n=1 Tax=Desulfovermiculus halophilus TaxID=339722 RepID=UPI0004874EF7|nr:TrmH family RNA methyltransferase [Desulfovermiculus halophilus]
MRQITEHRKQRIRDVLSRRQPDLTLVMDNIHDPHNVSAVLRSCDAFGVQSVHLYYTREEFPRPGRKSSASASKWVDLHRHTSSEELAGALRSRSMSILGARFSPQAVPVHTQDLARPTAIVLGNEHQGVSPELVPLLDGEVYIPMQGMVESLNVSVAGAVMLYESWRQRNQQGMYDQPALAPADLGRLFAQWAQK